MLLMKYPSFEHLLICPQCKASLSRKEDHFYCTGSGCGCSYPIVFDVPVMISCNNTVFKQSDFFTQAPPDIFFKQYRSPVLRFLKKMKPDVTLNYTSKKNYAAIGDELAKKEKVSILIVGGSIDGNGIRELKERLPANTIMVESDVAHGPNTNIIFDSHEIPFANNVFDLVIVQAVLEHVLDPFACVAEITRVLKEGGAVYAETPFMQQVHGGQYDFHRFTFLGHRRLFRHFREVSSGLVAGPGSSLAWSLRYFITSFARSKRADQILSYMAHILVFWVKYFDYILNNNKASLDAACGYFFLGKKEEGYTLPDTELLQSYKGFRY
jgi:SAM-dependent methyltransferase/uncharacterized protein YbaR (Trm112 family)